MPSSRQPERAIRILIADDDPLYAEALMTALGEDDRLDVVGIAADGREAVDLGLELQPDVILMDMKMPLVDGVGATRRLRDAGSAAQILIMTGADEEIGFSTASSAGASGFVRKERGLDELRQLVLESAFLAVALGLSTR
jgi:DNA-binding NarL/FixJ family response regulator